MLYSLKPTLLLISLVIFTLGIEGCGSTQTSMDTMTFDINPPFEIEEAYYQKWVAGTKEGGLGIKIHIVFASIKPEVKIGDVYFRNQILKPVTFTDNPYEYLAHFPDNARADVVMDIDPIKESQNTPSQDFPFQLNENEVVIGYLVGEKKNYYKISLSEKKSIAYPQSNPNPQK